MKPVFHVSAHIFYCLLAFHLSSRTTLWIWSISCCLESSAVYLPFCSFYHKNATSLFYSTIYDANQCLSHVVICTCFSIFWFRFVLPVVSPCALLSLKLIIMVVLTASIPFLWSTGRSSCCKIYLSFHFYEVVPPVS